MQKKRIGNIKPIILPISGEKFEINGHDFEVSDVKHHQENKNYIATFNAESALIKVSITLKSNLPIFKLDE